MVLIVTIILPVGYVLINGLIQLGNITLLASQSQTEEFRLLSLVWISYLYLNDYCNDKKWKTIKLFLLLASSTDLING